MSNTEATQVLTFGGVGLLVVFLLLYGSCSRMWREAGDSARAGPTKTGAYFWSQEYVKAALKAPSTAKFPWYSDSFVSDLGGGRFEVRAYVDAQNAFGAMLRSNYTCVVSSTTGDHWTLESIDIQ
ncbi:MAG: hypothetical protein HY318_07850 [Armatimonadetes bacterium]|nr:hypothetical protein [Armatimonadota bacterium]